jgi:predicted dithiol-disulfide oxidoreductase (DUF899 family)
MARPRVVSRGEWLAARKELLAKEKELTRRRDSLNVERRRLPMVWIEKDYVFEGPNGRCTLGDLFEGRRQLIVYHFMFDRAWDEGCPSCSFVADSFAGALVHLAARDTSFAVISRAPIAKIERFKKRMGWKFPWLSSFGSDFNYDFQVTLDENHTEYNYAPVSAQPAGYPQEGQREGLSVFLRDGDRLFHTYSTYQRGLIPSSTRTTSSITRRSAARRRTAGRWHGCATTTSTRRPHEDRGHETPQCCRPRTQVFFSMENKGQRGA